MTISISEAIKSLTPNAQFIVADNDYSQIDWISTDIPKPSKADVDKEIQRLESESAAIEYRKLRENEYPDFREYLDAVVKGDQEQMNKYIADCLAIKEKYPKPI